MICNTSTHITHLYIDTQGSGLIPGCLFILNTHLCHCLHPGLSQLVETQQVVTVTLGGDAHFSCRLMEPKDVLQVTWQKETQRGNENMATYNKRFGMKVNLPFQGKVEFVNVGLQNCSIIIRGVSKEDESCYRCLFNTYPDGSFSGTTCLQVNELYGPTLLVTQTNETHPQFSKLTISCSATGRPAPIVNLDKTTQLTVENSTPVKVTNPNKTVTVTITSTVKVSSLPANYTIIRCVASSGFDSRRGSIKIPNSLSGPTTPPVTNDGWIRVHGILVVVMCLVIITLFCTCWQCKKKLKCREMKDQSKCHSCCKV
ncbi:hypothetical protein DPEC_G00155750 [Dallia pectoralis]|uniref:Uncharacterized protein n=1 Tax=Dallia pectoralis TaxID=75939 RepID=A0ACC2GKQ4_DALPE|nr:hypothetical protein DPEC_G00155750 [Dallia pectoralis]